MLIYPSKMLMEVRNMMKYAWKPFRTEIFGWQTQHPAGSIFLGHRYEEPTGIKRPKTSGSIHNSRSIHTKCGSIHRVENYNMLWYVMILISVEERSYNEERWSSKIVTTLVHPNEHQGRLFRKLKKPKAGWRWRRFSILVCDGMIYTPWKTIVFLEQFWIPY